MKGIAGILGCLFFSFIIVFYLIGRFVYKSFIYYFKPHHNVQENEEPQDNGRQQQQYTSYSDARGKYYDTGKAQSEHDQAGVYDKRDPKKANKKIFAPDEGEYVDYEEES
jgi:uncharacterized protein YxeA